MVLLGFGNFSAFAQDDQDYAQRPTTTVDSTFQLSSFQLPEFRRRALTTEYGLSNQFRTHKSHQLWQYHNDWSDREESRKSLENYFSLNGNIVFSDIHYTRNHQKETYISSNIKFDTEYYRNRVADPSAINNKLNIAPYVDFRQVNRRYLNESLFVGYNPSIAYGLTVHREREKQKENYDNKTNQISQNLRTQVRLEVGHGRIEQVGDARHAIHIFDALARRGITSSVKSSDDIIRFAEFIAELKNKRFLDARHRKIYEMEALDSFLLANGFRDTLSMAYFTTLEDFWVHGNTNRASGKQWVFFTAPGYDFGPTKTKSYRDGDVILDAYQSEHFLHTMFGISFIYERPINLFWQNSFSSSLVYRQRNIRWMGKSKLTDEKGIFYRFWPGASYSLNQRISYFPTTRTSAYVGYHLFYNFLESTSLTSNFKNTNHSFNVNVNAGASYFFSPQLQLKLDAGLWYSHNKGDARNFNNSDFKSRASNFIFPVELSLNYTFY